jgi:hypothetical protein
LHGIQRFSILNPAVATRKIISVNSQGFFLPKRKSWRENIFLQAPVDAHDDSSQFSTLRDSTLEK